MKKILYLLITLSGTALACSKEGYAVNNLIKAPKGMLIKCEGALYDAAKAIYKPARWLEVAATPGTKEGEKSLNGLYQGIKNAGYKLAEKSHTKDSILYKFTKANSLIITMTRPDAVTYTIIMGR